MFRPWTLFFPVGGKCDNLCLLQNYLRILVFTLDVVSKRLKPHSRRNPSRKVKMIICLEVETKGATEFRTALPIYIVRCQQVSWQRRGNAPKNASARRNTWQPKVTITFLQQYNDKYNYNYRRHGHNNKNSKTSRRFVIDVNYFYH